MSDDAGGRASGPVPVPRAPEPRGRAAAGEGRERGGGSRAAGPAPGSRGPADPVGKGPAGSAGNGKGSADPAGTGADGAAAGSARSAAAKGAALAREKLAQAKSDAARRGQLPRREPRRRASGARRDAGDPQLLGRAIADLLSDRGWEQPAAIGGVFGRWPEIVGADMAAHTKPETFADGEVVVVADSTAWATQVRLLARTLVRRLNEELGDGTVQKVKVRGPQNGPRSSGGLRVTGSRGPGDTYG
ncbi:DUF721 domain-containing protein [Streptosporangium sp. NPDC000509]|uniref:DUF721 domain-containing protein n=1 Tax=Streptosporangium sp. NPDC000509 TaxID=3366186 RepID=UPI0036A0305B